MINIDMWYGDKKEDADKTGESVNGFIRRIIKEKIEVGE